MKRNPLFIVDNLDVKTPCSVSNSNFIQNQKGQWCNGCRKQVYDTVKHTKFEMAILLISKKGKLCIRIGRDKNKNINYKSGLVKKSYHQLLYFTKRFIPASFFLFSNRPSNAQEYDSNDLSYTAENFHTATFGDVFIEPPFFPIMIFIEGVFGLVIVLLFFILFLISTIFSFFQKDKSKKKRKLIWGLLFLFLSILIFAIRSFVSYSNGLEYLDY
jgi:hypothetical protein